MNSIKFCVGRTVHDTRPMRHAKPCVRRSVHLRAPSRRLTETDPSSGEGAVVDESLLVVKLTILWVVLWAVVDMATSTFTNNVIWFGIFTAPFFAGAVLGVRYCWLYGLWVGKGEYF